MIPKVQIIYASTSGNVLAVCEKIQSSLKIERINSDLLRAESTGIDLILSGKYFIFATSTWEHGVINPYFNKLLKDMSKYDLSHKYAGMVGLGDTRYEPHYFCKGIDDLKSEFESSGGRTISTVLKLNGDPYPLLDNVVDDWAKLFIVSIKKYEIK